MIVNQFAEEVILKRLVNIKREEDSIAWPNLFVNCTTTSFEKDLPETSLTLITNRTGEINCKLANKELKICSSTFIIVNPFLELKYTIDNKQSVETNNIHFNYRFATHLFNYYTGSDESLLDDFELNNKLELPVFYNELYFKNTSIASLINELLVSNDEYKFEKVLSEIFLQMLLTQTDCIKKMKSLKYRKKSTQQELYKRISIAKDILFHSYAQSVSIEKISKEICLSKYHFTRLFGLVYGTSPYQFLKIVRLEKVKNY